ncbi:hypothetical protein TPCCA_0538a [Treponema paraluiscuniculi Cuniculi A]|uniref:Uncharacterized protein n=2 Tax=Treponema paraluiscuniculi TaxID=53435 RepID=F7XSY8_TREPU|nr:hypothetical protein TPCCA_0538a [Treponema paraluiscuniculi Cuniculi A]WKC72405.1 hypothetical protein TPLL2_0538a [Treponema paraluiscuniculi]
MEGGVSFTGCGPLGAVLPAFLEWAVQRPVGLCAPGFYRKNAGLGAHESRCLWS